MPLQIYSHNVNGLDRNRTFVTDTCTSVPHCIYGLQEHWLRPPTKRSAGVNALMSLHTDLDGWGTSAMKSSMKAKIMSGRPFGGTGFVWSKQLSSSIKPRPEYRHERVTVLELSSSVGSVLVINCYLPFFKTNDVSSQAEKYIETVAFIDSIITSNPNCHYIIMGDFNCDIYNGSNDFTVILNSFISEHNLHCIFDSMPSFNPASSYTRFNLKQKSFTLLDYVFVSSELTKHIIDTSIFDSGASLSDHHPLQLSLSIDLFPVNTPPKSSPSIISWRSVKGTVKTNYERVMEECLAKVHVPHIIHGDTMCNSCDHLAEIERYYNDIVECIYLSDQQLPRSSPAVSKTYWSDELNSLKHDSIVANDFWKANGCPRTGPFSRPKRMLTFVLNFIFVMLEKTLMLRKLISLILI